ncbi:hypothetical protein [Streptomyces sp. KL109B]|uniref:hypothetical protein n=1 Tax=Streptomyces sp. KL109B TaxID=3045155 RepID=UPI00278C34D3|nr:hypothetical protein [Streptomyces sp. KL109B]
MTHKAAVSSVLLVLACLLVPLGTLSTWAKYEIGDSDRYVSTMAPLAGDPGVQNAVADAVTTGVMKNVDVGALDTVLTGYLHDAVVSFTDTDAFRGAWNTANRAAHDAVQQALDEGTTGPVTLDLAPVTEQVKRQLEADGVPFAGRIPVSHTEVTLLSAGDLAELRGGFHVLQLAGLWLPLAAVACAVAGLALAANRRRALAATALGAALAAAALLVALPIARALTLDDITGAANKAAAAAVYDALTSPLGTASWVFVGVGAVAAFAVWGGRDPFGRVRNAVLRLRREHSGDTRRRPHDPHTPGNRADDRSLVPGPPRPRS